LTAVLGNTSIVQYLTIFAAVIIFSFSGIRNTYAVCMIPVLTNIALPIFATRKKKTMDTLVASTERYIKLKSNSLKQKGGSAKQYF
jgi:hypothetical protein